MSQEPPHQLFPYDWWPAWRGLFLYFWNRWTEHGDLGSPLACLLPTLTHNTGWCRRSVLLHSHSFSITHLQEKRFVATVLVCHSENYVYCCREENVLKCHP